MVRHRLLNRAEIVQVGDEYLLDGKWYPTNKPGSCAAPRQYRRKLHGCKVGRKWRLLRSGEHVLPGDEVLIGDEWQATSNVDPYSGWGVQGEGAHGIPLLYRRSA